MKKRLCRFAACTGRVAYTTITATLLLVAGCAGTLMAGGVVTPDFGPNVSVFTPSMSAEAMQAQIDRIYAAQEKNQFGPARNALLFAPGEYKLDLPVGYYTQVLGLGA